MPHGENRRYLHPPSVDVRSGDPTKTNAAGVAAEGEQYL